MTPSGLALTIVEHFRPCGRILEPCAGKGSFLAVMPGCDWCEIDEDRDFLKVEQRYDWIVTNPPWSQFRKFLTHAMKVSDNIVFLCLVNAWFMRARQRDIAEAGFGLVEVLRVPMPPRPWPQTGFELGAGWLRRHWTGSTNFSTPREASLSGIQNPVSAIAR